MTMKPYTIPLVLIRDPRQIWVRDSKKLRQIIFIDKPKAQWVDHIKGRAERCRMRVINSNINKRHNNISKCHNNIIRQIIHRRLTKFIQMPDRDFIPTLMRFQLRHIIHNMMLTNIMFRLLILMEWSKAGRHQIVQLIRDNL